MKKVQLCSSAMIRDLAGRPVSITISRHAVSGFGRDLGAPIKGGNYPDFSGKR
jgi:hypothetical protein